MKRNLGIILFFVSLLIFKCSYANEWKVTEFTNPVDSKKTVWFILQPQQSVYPGTKLIIECNPRVYGIEYSLYIECVHSYGTLIGIIHKIPVITQLDIGDLEIHTSLLYTSGPLGAANHKKLNIPNNIRFIKRMRNSKTLKIWIKISPKSDKLFLSVFDITGLSLEMKKAGIKFSCKTCQ